MSRHGAYWPDYYCDEHPFVKMSMLIAEMDRGGGTLLSYRATQAVDRILGGDACILLRHRELAFRNYNLSGDGGYVFCRPVFGRRS